MSRLAKKKPKKKGQIIKIIKAFLTAMHTMKYYSNSFFQNCTDLEFIYYCDILLKSQLLQEHFVWSIAQWLLKIKIKKNFCP